MNELEQKTELLPEAENSPQEETVEQPKKEKSSKLKQFIQLLIFTGFMVSAGVIQFVTTGLLSTWTGLMSEDSDYYWIAYLVGLVFSVIWSFTFNRKFTFKAANNVPLAMGLVILYYCAFAPLSTFGANAIVNAWKTAAGNGWDQNYEMVITASMMILNFITEFFWDKFVVFNEKVTSKLEKMFRKKSKEKPEEETNLISADVTCEPLSEVPLPDRLLLNEGTPLSPENEIKEPESIEETKDDA